MKRAFLSLCVLCAPWLMAQSTADHPLPTQTIGVDDLIAISVYRSPELSLTVRVESNGAIELPLLKEPVHAAGLMPNELESAIADALKNEGLLVNPVVTVSVSEYASRPISVMGAVNKPLTFQAVGRVTLLDALAKAEGLAKHADQEILVTLPKLDDELKPLIRRIPVRSLIDSANPELNLALTGGEEIRVPEAGRVFVVGNVKKPGAYLFPDKDATVLRILALAEGLAPYSQKQAFIYRPEPEAGLKREIPIELAKIMKRESPDIPLQINDILYIPDNSGKRATMNVIDRVVGFGAATVSGVLIWGR
jgi:polysaccharide export outer membrane protein